MRSSVQRSAAASVFLLILLSCTTSVPTLPAVGPTASRSAGPASSIDWPSYLFNSTHSSVNDAAKAITPANAQTLTPAWQWVPERGGRVGQPPRQLLASPTVVNGVIYIGSNSGDFYALMESTGEVLWKRFLGFRPAKVCGARGITSTAAIATPKGSQPLVFVGGGNGNLYALEAKSGNIAWKALVVKLPGYVWGSPLVMSDRVYIGVSSQCDRPLVRGGVKQFDAKTGKLLHTFWNVPQGEIGGSVWSSLAGSSKGSVFVSTGNAPSSIGASYGILRLDSQTLTMQDTWKVADVGKRDYDFGASPTLFTGKIGGQSVGMVGACNKNGKFYALRQAALAAGPVWVFQVNKPWPDESNCLGGAIWDSSNSRLFVAGGKTHIGTRQVPGSIRRLNPSTGGVVWERPLPGAVWGSSSANGQGVVAVPNYGDGSSANVGVFLINESDGSLLASIDTNRSAVFAQPVFADGYLLVATVAKGLVALATAS